MRKIFYCIILLLLFTATNCLPPQSTSPNPTSLLTERISALESKNKSLDEALAKHGTSINELYSNKLSKSEYAPAASTYSRTELYTREEVDKKISDLNKRIDQWTNPITTPTPPVTPGSSTGSITCTTTPTNLQILGSGSQLCFTARIYNGMNQWQYVKPIMTLNTQTVTKLYGNKSPGNGSTPGIVLSYTASGISISTANSNIQFSPDINTVDIGSLTSNSYASIMCIPISGGSGSSLGELYVAPGQYIDVLVCVTVRSETPVIWSVSMTMSNRGL